MHKELQPARLDDTGIEAYGGDLDYIGHQFGVSHIDHAEKALHIHDFEESDEIYPSGLTIFNSHDHWTPLQRAPYLYHESKRHDISDGYSLKRSHTLPVEHPNSGCGSTVGGSMTPLMSVSSCLDSRTEYSWPPDDFSSYNSGVTGSRQSRTKSREDSKLRCNKCPWVGKTPSEKRLTSFYFVFFDCSLT